MFKQSNMGSTFSPETSVTKLLKMYRLNYAKAEASSLSFKDFPVRQLLHNIEAIQVLRNENNSVMNAK